MKQVIIRGIVVLALSIPPAAMGAESQLSEATQQLAASGNWQDRAGVFAELNLDTADSMMLEQANATRNLAKKLEIQIDPRVQEILYKLLETEIRYQKNPPEGGLEDETEYFLQLVAAAGLYGDERLTPLIFDESIVSTGTLAYSAAARTGDRGVATLVQKMHDMDSEFYADYHGIACLMQQHHLVQEKSNIKTLETILIVATKARDDLYRSFAATCLKWLPRDKALPILTRMENSDPSLRVRENAREALRTIGTAQ